MVKTQTQKSDWSPTFFVAGISVFFGVAGLIAGFFNSAIAETSLFLHISNDFMPIFILANMFEFGILTFLCGFVFSSIILVVSEIIVLVEKILS